MNRPVTRSTSLPLPGFADAPVSTATPGTPAANDSPRPRAARSPSASATMRKLADALTSLTALAATMEAAKPARRRASKRTPKAAPVAAAASPAPSTPSADDDTRALAASGIRTDLAPVLVRSEYRGEWSVEVPATLWFGVATVHVVWSGVLPEGGRAYFFEHLDATTPAALARIASQWLLRSEGADALATMDVQAVEIEADGRTLLRLRWEHDAWVSLDERAAQARLDAALAAPPAVTAEALDAIDTAHCLELQRLNAEGIPTRALDDETLRATRPAFTPAVEAAPVVRGEAPDSILRLDPPVRPAPTATTPRAPARRVSRSVESAVADMPRASGGPSRPPREATARAARSPSDASPRGGR